MTTHRHYVPILRWKRAEWDALGTLGASVRSQITPLIEITPRSVAPRKKRPSIDEMLRKNVKDLQTNWRSRPAFVDVAYLDGMVAQNGVHPLTLLGQEALRLGVCLIPVTNPYRPAQFQAVVADEVSRLREGVCIRLFRRDIRSSTAQDLTRLLAKLSVLPSDSDLILDYQVTPAADADFDYAAISAVIPNLKSWRTVTIASGSFPKDLSRFTVGQHELPRRDWQMWNALIGCKGLPRSPAYGDYTIQHALYGEPPDFPNFSASIRYTHHSYWVIMRGEGVFNDDGPGFDQWPANAQLLCDRSEFCGSNFSDGDAYIYRMSLQTSRTGTAESWLRAGINHHLTFAVGQVSSLGDA